MLAAGTCRRGRRPSGQAGGGARTEERKGKGNDASKSNDRQPWRSAAATLPGIPLRPPTQ
jgi:hypothetical protein